MQAGIGQTNAQTVTIDDNDAAEVMFTTSAQTTGENSPVTITVELNMLGGSTSLANAVSVDIVDLLSGTALNPADYSISGVTVLLKSSTAILFLGEALLRRSISSATSQKLITFD
jgi:hypothetical protein